MSKTEENASRDRIPEEELVELVERAQERLEDRIKRLRRIENHLRQYGRRLLKRARAYKTLIIVFGAVMATRVAFDENWASFKSVVAVVSTLISAAIAVLGGLDSAFKPGETGTEINFLRARCAIGVDEIEQDWARCVERLGVCEEALEHTDPLLARLNKQCGDIETRLAQLGIPLPK